MNSPGSTSSPTFKNLKFRHKQSPVELKEKMRKNYKDKVQNCRNMLLTRFRGTVVENDVRDTLIEIYKSMFNFSNEDDLDKEESEVLEEIKTELVEEELSWWLQEYEKSQMDNIDWSSIEQDDNVICPVCQKNNFTLQNGKLSCSNCKIVSNTNKSLPEIKQSVMSCIEKHSAICTNEAQFTVVPEFNETHIYLMCEKCLEMQSII